MDSHICFNHAERSQDAWDQHMYLLDGIAPQNLSWSVCKWMKKPNRGCASLLTSTSTPQTRKLFSIIYTTCYIPCKDHEMQWVVTETNWDATHWTCQALGGISKSLLQSMDNMTMFKTGFTSNKYILYCNELYGEMEKDGLMTRDMIEVYDYMYNKYYVDTRDQDSHRRGYPYKSNKVYIRTETRYTLSTSGMDFQIE